MHCIVSGVVTTSVRYQLSGCLKVYSYELFEGVTLL
jgi:hypothetical protein